MATMIAMTVSRCPESPSQRPRSNPFSGDNFVWQLLGGDNFMNGIPATSMAAPFPPPWLCPGARAHRILKIRRSPVQRSSGDIVEAGINGFSDWTPC